METEFAVDCPWCAGHMNALDAAAPDAGEAFACSTCAIVVELAPDSVRVPVVLAA